MFSYESMVTFHLVLHFGICAIFKLDMIFIRFFYSYDLFQNAFSIKTLTKIFERFKYPTFSYIHQSINKIKINKTI